MVSVAASVACEVLITSDVAEGDVSDATTNVVTDDASDVGIAPGNATRPALMAVCASEVSDGGTTADVLVDGMSRELVGAVNEGSDDVDGTTASDMVIDGVFSESVGVNTVNSDTTD